MGDFLQIRRIFAIDKSETEAPGNPVSRTNSSPHLQKYLSAPHEKTDATAAFANNDIRDPDDNVNRLRSVSRRNFAKILE